MKRIIIEAERKMQLEEQKGKFSRDRGLAAAEERRARGEERMIKVARAHTHTEKDAQVQGAEVVDGSTKTLTEEEKRVARCDAAESRRAFGGVTEREGR